VIIPVNILLGRGAGRPLDLSTHFLTGHRAASKVASRREFN
jgi:hypothetical protein